MRLRASVLLLSTIACGRIDFAPVTVATDANADDGAVDSSCMPAWHARTVELGAPRELTELAAIARGDLSLTDDGLQLYMWGGPDIDFHVSTRATRQDTWGPAVLISELSSPQVDYRLSTSRDGLVAVFNSNRSGTHELWHASRPRADVPFDAPSQVLVANLLGSGDNDYDAELSADGLTVYFSRALSGGRRLMRATRATTSDPFGAPELIAEVAGVAHDPTISGDQFVLAYASFGAVPGLQYRTRERVDEPFGPAIAIPIANPVNPSDVELSGDGCEVYYRTTDTTTTLWVATVTR